MSSAVSGLPLCAFLAIARFLSRSSESSSVEARVNGMIADQAKMTTNLTHAYVCRRDCGYLLPESASHSWLGASRWISMP